MCRRGRVLWTIAASWCFLMLDVGKTSACQMRDAGCKRSSTRWRYGKSAEGASKLRLRFGGEWISGAGYAAGDSCAVEVPARCDIGCAGYAAPDCGTWRVLVCWCVENSASRAVLGYARGNRQRRWDRTKCGDLQKTLEKGNNKLLRCSGGWKIIGHSGIFPDSEAGDEDGSAMATEPDGDTTGQDGTLAGLYLAAPDS
ncbi:hypothetical protein B0H17DRAFT_1147677 [Mycena rosella]|uniref:Uncharacterized protein n=1 Tax=Mycena rosella TaxID=1033263 RepID=A0AAD7CL67_MYCRO|nr:hypothetical protein B0H17DRAFT_1147677 [Mycena rosella]